MSYIRRQDTTESPSPHYPKYEDTSSSSCHALHTSSRKRRKSDTDDWFGGDTETWPHVGVSGVMPLQLVGGDSEVWSQVGVSGVIPLQCACSEQVMDGGGEVWSRVESATPLQTGDQLVPGEEEEEEVGLREEEEEVKLYDSVSKKRKYTQVKLTSSDIQDTPTPWHTHQYHLSSSKGLFHALPTELLHLILSLLPHHDLSSLALASWGMNSALREYAFTAAGSRHILPDTPLLATGKGHVLSHMPFGEENLDARASVQETAKEFETFGLLMKQITMFQPLRSRLGVASFFLNKLESTHQSLVMFSGHSSAYHCFGCLLFTFVQGWDYHDKEQVFNLIQGIARLESRVAEVLGSPPSSLPLMERDVRLLHRRVFLDHASSISDGEYVFWLTLILRQWPVPTQARLLFLLLAPENSQGFISWTEVCGCSNVQHEMDFSELANSLRLLLELNPQDWSVDTVVTIVDELTSTPNGWCLENVSQLLILCGQGITEGVLGHRASRGKVKDLVALFFYLGNACAAKDGPAEDRDENVRWFLDILRNTLSMFPASVSRRKFIYNLVGTWQDYLETLFDDCTPEEAESDEVQTEFASVQGNVAKLLSVLLTEAVNE